MATPARAEATSPRTLTRRSLLVAAGSAFGCARPVLPPSSPSPLLGAPLPGFSGTTLNGSEFDSNASRGLVLTVAFFAFDDTSSARDIEAAGALYSDHPELVMVGVSLDETVERARSQVGHHGLHFPILFDRDRSVASLLGVTQPRTILAVDRHGRLRWVGDATRAHQMRQAAEALLSESG